MRGSEVRIESDPLDEMDERFRNPEPCHLFARRDDGVANTMASPTRCGMPPSGHVAVHSVVGFEDTAFCAGCGRPRCPECAADWRRENGVAA